MGDIAKLQGARNIGPGIMIFTEREERYGTENVCRYFYLIIPLSDIRHAHRNAIPRKNVTEKWLEKYSR